MKFRAHELPNDTKTLQEMLLAERQLSAEHLANKDQQLSEKDQLIAKLQQQLVQFWEDVRLLRQQKFGKSSEHNPHQADLFNEAEATVDEAPVPEKKQTITYERSKPKRKPLPENLPREQIVHDIEDKTCDCCGHELHKIGEDITEKLEVIPMQLKVLQHIRPKYSCRYCEHQGTQVHIQQQKMPPVIIDKGYATPSLLSLIITNKFQFSLPLYRQEKLFAQYGIHLSRQTQSEWIIKCANALKPIYQHLKQHLLKQPVIHSDETRLQVNQVDKSQCYMFIYCCGTDSPPTDSHAPPNIVLFDYQPTKSAECIIDYLDGYQGYIHVDGYQAFESTLAKLVGCWAHARRKYTDIIKSQSNNKTSKAQQGLSFIQKLYAIEKRLKGKSPSEKYQTRQTEALPIINAYKTWLEKSVNNVMSGSKISAAINYSLNQWEKLIRYLEDGRLSIDNNRVEREAKHFAIGRKNFLFCHTESGANSSAVLYSIVETCKVNGVNPTQYLTYLFEQLAHAPSDLEPLMPWNFDRA